MIHDAIHILTEDMARVTGECSQNQGHSALAVVCSNYTYQKMMQPMEKDLFSSPGKNLKRIHAASIMGSPVYFDDKTPEGTAVIFAHMCASEIVYGFDKLIPYMVSVMWSIFDNDEVEIRWIDLDNGELGE